MAARIVPESSGQVPDRGRVVRAHRDAARPFLGDRELRRQAGGLERDNVWIPAHDPERDRVALVDAPGTRGAGRLLLAIATARVGAKSVDAARVAVHEEEGTQRASRPVEPFRLFPEPEEHLLDRLFGDASFLQHSLREREDRARMTPVHLREGVRVVPGDGDDEPDVVGVRERESAGHLPGSSRPALRDEGCRHLRAGATEPTSYPRGMQDANRPADRERAQPELVDGPAPLVAGDGEVPDEAGEEPSEQILSPTKLIRIASMVRTMLDEVRRAPLDDAGRRRMREIHERSLQALDEVLSPDLQKEVDEVVLPLTGDDPTESELRLAQAQLVGWLEGLFHGIQATLFTQQAVAQSQFEEMRKRRALEGGMGGQPGGSGYL